MMADTESRLCPGYIRTGGSGPWGCILPRDHEEQQHKDVNGNRWPLVLAFPPGQGDRLYDDPWAG